MDTVQLDLTAEELKVLTACFAHVAYAGGVLDGTPQPEGFLERLAARLRAACPILANKLVEAEALIDGRI